jgi:hypothetical protein
MQTSICSYAYVPSFDYVIQLPPSLSRHLSPNGMLSFYPDLEE